ncbi:hypothetical protein GGX14DRAFT_600289 [Mycena pura]|uniref:BTB domain-containing protein n=1 Tax=Mycena pura TaxID=153505 RepID=A0AAD6XZ40_9AGAR|nr:hypothetical protein GGX14DRAFT_600289 [Mycena pura]
MNQHESLYFQDGSVSLQTSDGTVFRIYRQHLISQSTVFATWFSLPFPKLETVAASTEEAPAVAEEKERERKRVDEEERLNSLRDGSTDELALLLGNKFTSQEHEVFFRFVINTTGWSKELAPLPTLCTILKTCHFYDVQGGMDYAIDGLEQHAVLSNFSAALRFRLGCDYSIREWVRRAFDELISVPVNDFSPEEEGLLGTDAFLMLAKTQAKIMDHRTTLAVLPPPPTHALCCHNNSYCKIQWEAAWLSIPAGVAGWLLKHELSGAEIYEKLNWFSAGTMTGECLRLTCDNIQLETPTKKSVLREEEDIVDRAIANILRYVA